MQSSMKKETKRPTNKRKRNKSVLFKLSAFSPTEHNGPHSVHVEYHSGTTQLKQFFSSMPVSKFAISAYILVYAVMHWHCNTFRRQEIL